MYSVYIKYIRGKRMRPRGEARGWRSAVTSNQHLHSAWLQSVWADTLQRVHHSAGAPLCWRRTKIDYSDALSTGLFRKVFTLFYHFTHPHNSLEVDVRSILDGKKKVMTHM